MRLMLTVLSCLMFAAHSRAMPLPKTSGTLKLEDGSRVAATISMAKSTVGLHRVSMIVAGKEETNLAADQKAAWQLVPKADRGTFATIAGAHHALPDEAPAKTTGLLLKIAAASNAQDSN